MMQHSRNRYADSARLLLLLLHARGAGQERERRRAINVGQLLYLHVDSICLLNFTETTCRRDRVGLDVASQVSSSLDA